MPVFGSENVSDYLLRGIEEDLGGRWAVESDPVKAADLILEHIEKLDELDTTDVPPTSHMFFTKTPMREDRVREQASPIAKLIDNAPRRHETFYVVPRVIE